MPPRSGFSGRAVPVVLRHAERGNQNRGSMGASVIRDLCAAPIYLVIGTTHRSKFLYVADLPNVAYLAYFAAVVQDDNIATWTISL